MNWKSIVKSVAPALGSALGGPAGGMAVKFIADKILGNPEATESEVADYVAGASPADMLKIKQSDHDFAVAMRELDIDLEKLEVDDRKSARDLGIKTSLIPQIILACIYVLAFSATLYAVFTGQVKMDSMQTTMANYLLGILSAGLMQIMNFFFGSSKSSHDKNKMLAK